MYHGDNVILLSHGDGGALTNQLVKQLFCKYFTGEKLQQLSDATVLPTAKGHPVLTTDAFVVDPLFFSGGDIGKLAVYGTVNDLAVSGATPQYLTASFILEEGLPLATLERVVGSMAEACAQAAVEVVAGDTKVVERGHGDQLFITTTGLGWLAEERQLGYSFIQPGDVLLVNGTLGDHGAAIMASRLKLGLEQSLRSDCAALNGIIAKLLQYCSGVRLMRDLTRGGLATAVKEIAVASQRDVYLEEADIPISAVVEGTVQLLGLDPLYLANEGKFLVIIAASEAGKALQILRQDSLGQRAQIIGEVTRGHGEVYLATPLGGTRSLDLLAGNPLPRIC